MSFRSVLIENVTPKLADIEGDILEIGVWLGELTRGLSALAAKKDRRVYSVDACDVYIDPMTTKWGYLAYYRQQLGVGNQEKILRENLAPLTNVEFLKMDSAKVTFPVAQKFAFAVIDGCHEPVHMKGDFRLAWKHLSKGGFLAMHDYLGDLPKEFSDAVDEVVSEVEGEVKDRYVLSDWWLVVEKA